MSATEELDERLVMITTSTLLKTVIEIGRVIGKRDTMAALYLTTILIADTANTSRGYAEVSEEAKRMAERIASRTHGIIFPRQHDE